MASDMPQAYKVSPSEAVLCIVDFQERLAAAMPEATRLACERNIILLLELAQRQGWPVLVCEQYPQGLGATVPSLAAAVGARSGGVFALEKVHFSATEAPGFDAIFQQIGRRQWIVTGMEAHVCVFQTVRGLLERGVQVHVPEDAVVSRSSANGLRGLTLCERMGAVVSCTETIVFDALGVAGTDDFKVLSKRLR